MNKTRFMIRENKQPEIPKFILIMKHTVYQLIHIEGLAYMSCLAPSNSFSISFTGREWA